MGRAMLDLFAVVIIIAAVTVGWVFFTNTRYGTEKPKVTRTDRSIGWLIKLLVGGMIVVFFLGVIFTMIKLFFFQNN